MAFYHITENGAKLCSTTPEKCPITRKTGDQHFSDQKEADKEYEKRMKKNYPISSLKVNKNKNNLLQSIRIETNVDVDESIKEISDMLKSIQVDGLENYPQVEKYYKTVANGEIPEEVPVDLFDAYETNGFILTTSVHSKLMEAGYFARVTQKFSKGLSEKIGKDSTILDPMAGKGFFVKAMREQGVKTIGTDDKSWKSQLDDSQIENIDAVESLKKYGNQVDHVVLAWSPLENDIDNQLYKTIKQDYPHITIILIGESQGGCTGSDNFWQSYEEDYENDKISVDFDQCGYRTTAGLHDHVTFIKFQ